LRFVRVNSRFLLLCTLLLAAGSAAAQHSIDPGTPATKRLMAAGSDSIHHTDTVHFHYTYSGTGTINNTNSLESYVLSNALKLSLAKKSVETNFTNSWVYGKENKVLTNNDFSSTLDMGLYKTIKHFYYWGMATYNHSVPLLINHQGQGGLGPGYDFIDKKTAILSFSDGILYELNDLYDSLYGQPGGNVFRRDRYNTFRNSAHLQFHWVIDSHYSIDGSAFLQNSLAHWNDDYILRLTGGASIKLYKWISFTASAAYSRFTRTRGRNTLISFGTIIQR
jgi:hypothetical protein